MTNQAERVYRAWNILTERAKQQRPITYKQLGDALEMHHRPVRFILGPIQDYCLVERLPALTILVTDQRGRLGSGFIALGADRFDEGLREVYSYPWQALPNPFEFASDGTEYKTLLNELLARPQDTEDIYRRVKVRGTGQIVFRDLLLRAYGKRCCFSDLSITEGLEAVHIVPWGELREERSSQRHQWVVTFQPASPSLRRWFAHTHTRPSDRILSTEAWTSGYSRFPACRHNRPSPPADEASTEYRPLPITRVHCHSQQDVTT